MRIFIEVGALGIVLVSAISAAADEAGKFPAAEAPPVVRAEFDKTQQSLTAKLSEVRKKAAALEAAKTAAFAGAKNQEVVLRKGIESFTRYHQLIGAKYVSADGSRFEPGLELEAEDIANINKLFESFLHASPLRGKVSAGQARNMLNWGVKRAEEVASQLGSPDEENNSELQIIAKQLTDLRTEEQKLLNQAESLGVQLNVPEPARRPAME